MADLRMGEQAREAGAGVVTPQHDQPDNARYSGGVGNADAEHHHPDDDRDRYKTCIERIHDCAPSMPSSRRRADPSNRRFLFP